MMRQTIQFLIQQCKQLMGCYLTACNLPMSFCAGSKSDWCGQPWYGCENFLWGRSPDSSVFIQCSGNLFILPDLKYQLDY